MTRNEHTQTTSAILKLVDVSLTVLEIWRLGQNGQAPILIYEKCKTRWWFCGESFIMTAIFLPFNLGN